MKKILAICSVMALCGTTSAFAMDHMKDKEHMEMKVDKHMKMMDTNNDNMVSKDEFMTAKGKKFADMDKNSDGMLSKDEMMEGKKAWKEKHKAMKEGK